MPGEIIMQDHSHASDQVKRDADASPEIGVGRIISYNLNEDERPDGIKVRFKIQIVTGKHAAALDARQAEAIRELLLWTRTCRMQPPPSR
jgi:hypothetical protein